MAGFTETPSWPSLSCEQSSAAAVSVSYSPFVVEMSYYTIAIQAYSMTRYVVENLRLDSAVVGTAMTYWHIFVSVHGLKKVDEIVLSAACTFLASKVEHHKVRLSDIVALVFEVDPVGGVMESWRDVVGQAELLLCYTLKFNFQVIHPVNRINELVFDGNKAVLECAQRLFLLSFVTPLCTRASAEEIVEALVYLAADGAERLEVYANGFNITSSERRDGIISVMLDALVAMRKTTKLPKIDNVISARRKRLREQESTRPSVACSSVGTASTDNTPCAPSVE
ncbi:cyclin 9 [Trypanosoma equiperdum]|uniref:Cyclin 9 n=3 Tax=Trypanozoon TaxID=39700 RepID=Q382D4_TRYB2|nr:cyclin 9 [Trypanosoma brucei gambiense DAL972]XP_829459.1 cyclin 9 [Trypanosoma brucei brucei TREU927]EAN80347.1 cyclin 9 [Trypanosoma brucei brucei TREU927]CBH18447.1 cyclin 9 [Trypanosoma brucei gambiense DAL972]SCU66234.1 cyclin 9 [Trypanosoma equiperdum]|eukprot:XP_011780711.1 cyclin 9 [Trypanosoma brucei gambiense DAL972]